jgi:malate dehydrogenase (oxaloacetate-decarboxylating)(NADP+)
VSLDDDALEYHAKGRAGKIKVVPTKSCMTAEDLSLAYSPGVAAPCLEIEKNPDDAYKYTAKGNLVAVISNGSAVLGLGNIGALAGKPVMEGKGVLFKRFADIDVFDIEVDTLDVEEMIKVCELISPTFGGINLEDIRAPECFEIEERLKESLDIPVFHDDQHGTAIISAAALLNGLKIQNKKIDEVKVVFSGAGAASISCAKLYKDLGVKAENILMTDSQGVLWKGRGKGFNKYKDEFVAETDRRTLGDALVDADVFVGLSQAGLVTKEMVKSMADRPLVFAMANPNPEITPIDAHDARSDAICATGRSDYANQVNNVLGFPFIFRGALDVRASKINEEMKQAAVYALAELAQRGEAVPDAVKQAYPGESFDFGPTYIIPKPFDPRVLLYVAPAVAKAAMDSGVATQPVDLKEYETKLQQMLGEIASL